MSSLKYFTRRSALNAATKFVATTDFNHLRSFPRAWLIRRTKHDPKLKSVRPADRIKWWNIVPGDRICLRGDADKTVHEVLSINRLSNRVFLKNTQTATKQGQPPQTKNYHYSKCQLFIGRYELPNPADPTGPWLRQPVFASRVGTSEPSWDAAAKCWMWRRYAVATVPKISGWYRGQRIRIKWPAQPKRKYPEAGLYDTSAEDVARVTYQLPEFNVGANVNLVPRQIEEREYLDTIYNPHLGLDYDASLPVEIFLEEELANPHSRAKKLERYHKYQANIKLLLKRITAQELKHLDGRTVRQAKADAAFKWREQVNEERSKKKKTRWMHTAQVQKWERKTNSRTKKEERQRRRLAELVLADEPNQVIPSGLRA
ncbi:hypothetical protein BJ165DRAFT_1420597 [Panaeolus papilionaceus]|nr:hypothetical protein BJ165DRAFT_1420597 [Panaeolus papilionaceus]